VVSQEANAPNASTQLQALFEERGVERVVVVGLTLDGRVKETALEAARDFSTSVVTEASAAVDREPGDGQRAIEEMRTAGVTIV
jgi:nicotinamidase-related amidase